MSPYNFDPEHTRVNWRPITAGEQVFQHLFATVGRDIEIRSENHGIDYLVSPKRFAEFARLSATLEVFMRAIRSAGNTFTETPGAAPREFGRQLREETDLPDVVTRNAFFCEALKHAGRVVVEAKGVSPAIGRSVLREGRQCYLCGVDLVARRNQHNSATLDHIWPLVLAGESLEENLLAACADCNCKKDHAATWVWGPVQSTYQVVPAGDSHPPSQIRLCLALARLTWAASEGSRPLTLKNAAQRIRPAIPSIAMKHDRRHVFFEFLGGIEAPT